MADVITSDIRELAADLGLSGAMPAVSGALTGISSAGNYRSRVGSPPPVSVGGLGTDETGFAAGYAAVLGVLSGLFTKRAGDILDIVLSAALEKLQRAIGDNNAQIMLNVQDRKRTLLAEKHEKLEAANQKQAEARKAAGRAKIWGWVKAGFSMLAAAAGIVCGGLLCWTGVGAVAMVGGVAMMIGGVASAVMAGDSTAKLLGGAGMSDGLAIAMTVVVVLSAVVSFGALMSGGLASAGGQAASQAAQASGASAQAAGQASVSVLDVSSRSFQTASIVGSAVAAAGSGVGDIGASVVNRKAAEHSAAAKELHADGLDISAVTQLIDDFFDIISGKLSAEFHNFNEMLAALQQSLNDRSRTLSRALYGG